MHVYWVVDDNYKSFNKGIVSVKLYNPFFIRVYYLEYRSIYIRIFSLAGQ